MDSDGNGAVIYIQEPAAADEDGMTAALVLQTEDGGETWTFSSDTVEMPFEETAGRDSTAAEDLTEEQVPAGEPEKETEEAPEQQTEPEQQNGTEQQTGTEEEQDSGRQAEPDPGQQAQPQPDDGGSSPGSDRENV